MDERVGEYLLNLLHGYSVCCTVHLIYVGYLWLAVRNNKVRKDEIGKGQIEQGGEEEEEE